MKALIDSKKASIDANKEFFDDKMEKLREKIPSLFDNLIENFYQIFHQYRISSQENDVEDDGLSEITKSTSKTKPSKSDLSGC